MALDQVFIMCKTENLKELITAAGHQNAEIHRIMIAGGTQVGHILARLLSKDEQKWEIKLIEPDPDLAESLANELRNVMVLNGNPTDPNLLAVEGIQEMDAFISVTDDEESNLISCLMAKHMEVRKTLSLVSKSQYIPLSQTIGLDAVVNVKAAASDEIHRQIRQGNLLSVKALQGINAEIIEVIAGNQCEVLNTPIHSMKLPEGMVIGGILNNGSSEIATGNTVIKKGDRVIIFATPQAITKVEDIFR
jgi:trk system potassium uptake protein TrkA